MFNLINNLRKTNNQKVIMEIYCLKMSLIFDNKEKNIITEENENDKKIITSKDDKKEAEDNINDEIKKIRINNSLAGANKQLKSEFVNKYKEINEYVSNKEYNSIANLLLKAVPEIVSDKNIIFSFKNNFDVILFDKNEELIQKLLEKIYNKKYLVVALTSDDCEKIKKEYINNIKKGIKYEYIEEKASKKKKKSKDKLEETAEDIFGDEIIKVD